MGSRAWSDSDWTSYGTVSERAIAAGTGDAVYKTFTSREMHPDLDPKKFTVRESRNSVGNPRSTPIILGLDVTGSMKDIVHDIMKFTLGAVIHGIFDRKPVSDPHIAFAAFGDVTAGDSAPLQITQFESDAVMLEQLSKIWVEAGGGPAGWESYNLPWHLAAYHTSADAFEKDDRKGYIFTFGDDGPPPDLNINDLARVYGRRGEVVATNAQILEKLATMYHVFHIDLTRRSENVYIKDKWQKVLGQNYMYLSDHTKLGELIVSTMQVVNGASVESVAGSWGEMTGAVVSKSLAHYKSAVTTSRPGAMTRFS